MIKAPQCAVCKDYISDLSCEAFDNIPREILINRHNHKKKYPGDNGIRFEKTSKGSGK